MGKEKKVEYTVDIAQSTQEAEQMRIIWQRMNPIPFAEIDYYLIKVNSQKEIVQPYTLLVSRNGIPQTLLVGYIENWPFEISIIGKTLLSIKVRCLVVVIGGVLGDVSDVSCSILIKEIKKLFMSSHIDMIFFSEISTGSSLYKFTNRISNFLYRDNFPVKSLHFKMTLPESIDAFYKQRKRKNNLLRKIRNLEKKFPGNIYEMIFTEDNQMDQFCNDAQTISEKTYQFSKGGGFIATKEMRRWISSLANNNKIKGYILYIKNNPCAFFWGIKHGNNFYLVNTGYDPDYSKYEVGTITMLKMIADLCGDTEVKYVDFGWLDTNYKRRFCDISWEEANLRIYAPTLKGFFLNSMRALSGITRCVIGGIDKRKAS